MTALRGQAQRQGARDRPTHRHAVHGEDTGDNLYNIMPPNAMLVLTQTKGRWQNALEGEFVAAKDEVSQVRNEIEAAGFALLHLRSRYQTNQWTLELGVENLFDRFYDLPLGGAYVG